MIVEQFRHERAVELVSKLIDAGVFSHPCESIGGDTMYVGNDKNGDGVFMIISTMTGHAVLVRAVEPGNTRGVDWAHLKISEMFNKSIDRVEHWREQSKEEHEAARRAADSGNALPA